jgi:hypothetical protein
MNSRGAMFRLSVSDLSKLAEGFYADGGNLYLSVERNKAAGFSGFKCRAGTSETWV